ncbi:hypothetical protein LSAT2_022632 [Lamellibrachia satsuma]|nr:hypothetical protein LSAT2_022632 [Lamellibrachia satsuma]
MRRGRLTMCRGQSTPVVSHQSETYQLPRRQKCGRPSLNRNVLARQSADRSRLKFRCRRGWNLVGDATLDCKRGRWNGDVPQCVSNRCRRLSALEHGTLTVQYGGGIVSFSCKRGYTLEGAPTLACDGYNWNGTAPKCTDLRARARRDRRHKGRKTHKEWLSESDYTCAGRGRHVSPPGVHNAVYFTKWAVIGNSARLYTVYRCRRGHLKGNNKMYCQSGRWRGKMPTCEVPGEETRTADTNIQRDQPPQKQKNAMSHEQWLRLSDYTCLGRSTSRAVAPDVPGSTKAMRYATLDRKPRLYVQYRCRHGYHLSVPAQKFMYCRKQRWIGRRPSCIKDEQGSGNGHKEVKHQLKTPNLPLLDQGLEEETPQAVSSGTGIRPCAVNNGNCEHKCSEYRGKAKCLCRPGYLLRRDRRTCKDVNNCARNNGGCSQVCVNTPGSYQCRCRPGFRLLQDGHTCVKPKKRRYGPARGRKQIPLAPRESTALASNGY